MTFDEYNTDDNFDKKESSLDELVKIGLSEGKTSDEIKGSLSPKWQKSKKISEFDNYVSKYSAPKEEPKAEEKTAPKVEEMTQTTEALKPEAQKKETTLDKATEDYLDKNNAIANAQEDNEYERQSEELEKRWGARLANIDKMGDSMRKIDDKLIDQLPTFMWKRYQQGEFGDPKSSDAKLRLAYFAMNNVVSKLKTIANADAQYRGRGPIFQDTESAYDKYQRTNLEEGLANRWNKYKQETQSAIDLAKQGGMSEESITDSIATISSNNRLQSAFNQMNERQKVFALQVLGEIGDKMGNMNDTQFVNTLMGMAAMGDSLDVKEAAGMLVYRTVKDPKKRDEILNKLGLLSGGIGGGLGAGLGGLIGGNEETEPNPDATLEDGTNVDAGKVMTNEDYDKIVKAAEDLGNKYYNGEIDEEKFRSEYGKLEAEMKKHGIYNKFKNIKSADAYIKQIGENKRAELYEKITDLNSRAKNGELKPSDYDEEFEKLKKEAFKFGVSEKDWKPIEKGKVKTETILKATEKKNKKK